MPREILNIPQHLPRLLQRRKMPPSVMLPKPAQIPRRRRPAPRNRNHLPRKQRIPKRLRDIQLRRIMALALLVPRLPIGIQTPRHRLREPVQRHRLEDRLERRVFIRPRKEFLPDPR